MKKWKIVCAMMVVVLVVMTSVILALNVMKETPETKICEKQVFPVTSIVVYQSNANNLVMVVREGIVNRSGVYSVKVSGLAEEDSIKIEMENGSVVQYWLDEQNLSFKVECNKTARIAITYFITSAFWDGRYNLDLDDEMIVLVGKVTNYCSEDFDDVTLILVAGKTHTVPDTVRDNPVLKQTISIVSCNAYNSEAWGTAWYNVTFVRSGCSLKGGSVDIGIYAVYWLSNVTLLRNRETYVQVWSADVNITEYVKIKDDNPKLFLNVKNPSAYSWVSGNVYSYKYGIFVGSDTIDYTPRNSSFEVEIGWAFDIVVDRDEIVENETYPYQNVTVRINITNKDITSFEIRFEEAFTGTLIDPGNLTLENGILKASFTLNSGETKMLEYRVQRSRWIILYDDTV
ncbi:MAG: hypothetical protein QMC80_03140 [Thermoplasmatales archaeon]|nr:hypothetical protein [Thermoplasmatales archaeon]